MLSMAAFQFGHPVLLFVLMESNNSLIHGTGTRADGAASNADNEQFEPAVDDSNQGGF